MERIRMFMGTSGATLECQTTSLEVGERAWKVKTRTSRNSGNHACGLEAQAGPKCATPRAVARPLSCDSTTGPREMVLKGKAI